MTTKKAVVVAVVTVAVVGAAIIGLDLVRSSDEAPIRVRNGSMDIIAAAGRAWKEEPNGDTEDSTPSYSHEPTGIDLDPFDKDLFVKVVPATASCTGNTPTSDGRMVQVEYTEAGGAIFTVTFKRAKSGLVNQRTKIRPREGLTLDSTATTVRRTAAGHVSRVRIPAANWECTFPNATALIEILICSSESRPECQ